MKAPLAIPIIFLLAKFTAAQSLLVNPSHATLVPGQDTGISVSSRPGFNLQLPVSATFSVSGPLVIERVDSATGGGKLVVIQGLAVGDGALSATTLGGASLGVIATFSVTTCGEAEPHVGLYVSRTGDQVGATAIGTPIGGTYEWFYGLVGDTSNPFHPPAPDFVWFFVVQGHPVNLWVRYITPCGAPTATWASEIPRRRSSRY